MGHYLKIDIPALKADDKYKVEPCTFRELQGFADETRCTGPIYKELPGVSITRLSDGKRMAFDYIGGHAYCHCSYSGKLASEVTAFVPVHTVTRTQ